jgi:DNA repair protein RadC
MTTLYVRDQSGFREADASDVLDRAQALIAQRYRAGSPVLTSPERTREFLRMHLGAYDRETFKAVLARNAAAIVLYHNHPSGLPEPSAADELITRRLKEALALIDVRVLDHLIVAESIYSMAEHGLL